MENITESLYLSEKYNIEGCVQACCGFLEVQASPENVLTAYFLAIGHKSEKMKTAMAFKIFRLRKYIFTRENMPCIARAAYTNILVQAFTKEDVRLMHALGRGGFETISLEMEHVQYPTEFGAFSSTYWLQCNETREHARMRRKIWKSILAGRIATICFDCNITKQVH